MNNDVEKEKKAEESSKISLIFAIVATVIMFFCLILFYFNYYMDEEIQEIYSTPINLLFIVPIILLIISYLIAINNKMNFPKNYKINRNFKITVWGSLVIIIGSIVFFELFTAGIDSCSRTCKETCQGMPG